MSYSSDMDQLIASAQRQGWRHNLTTKGHHQFYGPDKHTIVVFSGTPGDVRGYTNSLKLMESAGYINPRRGSNGPLNTELGDQIRALTEPKGDGTMPEADTEPQDKPKIGVSQAVRNYFAKHPNRILGREEIFMGAKMLAPTATSESVAAALSYALGRGELKRVARGQYILDLNNRFGVQPLVAKVAEPAPAPTPPPPAPEVPPVALDGGNVDADIAELDAALAALGRIEAVVRRNRDIMKQFAALKEMLNKIGVST